MTLHRFGYASTALIPFGEPELLQLRLAGENSNDRHGVTGLLLYDGQRFAQLVEGPEAGLRVIVDRIVRDRRHDRLDVKYDGPTEARQFADWSLKVHWRLAEIPPASFIDDIGAAVAGCPEAEVAAYFIDFAGTRP